MDEVRNVPQLSVTLPQPIKDSFCSGNIISIRLETQSLAHRSMFIDSGNSITHAVEHNMCGLCKLLYKLQIGFERPDGGLYSKLLELLGLVFRTDYYSNLELARVRVREEAGEDRAADVSCSHFESLESIFSHSAASARTRSSGKENRYLASGSHHDWFRVLVTKLRVICRGRPPRHFIGPTTPRNIVDLDASG